MMLTAESRLKMRLAKLGLKRGPHKPETIEKIRKANEGKKHLEESKAKMKQKKQEHWKDPAFRNRMLEVLHKIHVSNTQPRELRFCACGCGFSFEILITGKKRFVSGHNPNRLKSKAFPTSLEKRVISLVREFNLPFEYVGHGKVWINKANPDFVATDGTKRVLEVFCNYYKARKYGTVDNYQQLRMQKYSKEGFEVTFIGDDCLEYPDWKQRCLAKIGAI